MKFTKAEKIWLTLVLLFFFLYNLPFVPGYYNTAGTFIHGLLTLVPLWVIVYVGLFKVSRSYKEENSSVSDIVSDSQTDTKGTDKEETVC